MDEQQFEMFMVQWGSMLSETFKLELNQLYSYAPGYDGNAYGQGRNPAYAGNAPKSQFGSGALSNSITTTWNPETNSLDIEMFGYGQFVDRGVNPQPQYLNGKGSGGNSPFITALESWARGKGFQNPLSAAFAIRRNIWKFGIQPTGFYGRSIENITKLIEEVFPEKFEEMVEQFLNNTVLKLTES